jgi:hypothetical protein
MAVLYTVSFVISAIALYWAFGYAHEWAYAKMVKKSIPKTKVERTPMIVRGYIWGMAYMVVSLFFFK